MEFFFHDTLVVVSTRNLVILGSVIFGLVVGLVALIRLFWDMRR